MKSRRVILRFIPRLRSLLMCYRARSTDFIYYHGLVENHGSTSKPSERLNAGVMTDLGALGQQLRYTRCAAKREKPHFVLAGLQASYSVEDAGTGAGACLRLLMSLNGPP